MKFFENYLTHKTRAYVYSLLGGSILLIFWLTLNQIVSSQPVESIAQGNIDGNMVQESLGIYKDGLYKANTQTPWGMLEIAVTVTNGQWSNLDLVEIPNSNPSRFSTSLLAKQALEIQNNQVDVVSGATYTSKAFRDNLGQIIAESRK